MHSIYMFKVTVRGQQEQWSSVHFVEIHGVRHTKFVG